MGFGVEFVAASPAAMACGDVAQTDAMGSVGAVEGEMGGKAVGGKEFAVVLTRHFEHVAGIEQGV